MNEKRTENTPRIYVASLADYNCGRLLGKWIDATQGSDAIQDEIKELLYHSTAHNAEEWAIHDYENFAGIKLSESEAIDTVAEAARLIVEHGEIFGRLVENFGGLSALNEAERCMSESYLMAVDSLEVFAEVYLWESYSDRITALPDIIRFNIDYAAIARDLEIGGDIFSIELDGRFHIFAS